MKTATKKLAAGAMALFLTAGLPLIATAQQPAGQKGAAPAPTLKVGDKAPALAISEWVKGEPISAFKDGQVYVVEFWATWCPPCRVSIPHLSKLQTEYAAKGVTIVGISGVDRNGETLKKVQDFVAKGSPAMDYTVAFDDARKTHDAYMRAANQGGIPTAFVVDKTSTIVWIGNPIYPMGQLDEVVELTAAGKFSKAEREAFEARWKEKTAKLEAAQQKVGEAMAAGKHDDALKGLDDLAALDPSNAGQYSLMKFKLLLTEKKDADAAYAYAKEAVGKSINTAEALNDLAWTIVDDPEAPRRDFDLAIAAAEKAVAMTKEQDAAILDTLARAWHDKGDLEKAIHFQELAVKAAPAENRDEAQKTLDGYRSEKANPPKR